MALGQVIAFPSHTPESSRAARTELARLIEEGREVRAKNRALRQQLSVTVKQVSTLASSIAAQCSTVQVDQRIQLLTMRELKVLSLIAGGLSTKEIAGELKISFKTAVTHRTHLMAKLEMHNIADLTRLAIRSGLVPI